MEEFRRQFLLEAVETLKTLSKNFQSAEIVSDFERSEIFRTLHTIKGTAQTFGYQTASRLAHQLETLLSNIKAEKISESNDSKSLFLEGIELLIKSLEQKDFKIPDSFTEKIGIPVPSAAAKQNAFGDLTFDVPAEFLSQLSVQEKTILRSSLENGKNLFCLEIGFELADFADGLIKFRESLSQSGEIIATLPGAKFNAAGKIGFRILFATQAEKPKIELIAEKNNAKIIFDSSKNNFPNDARGILGQVVKYGKETAKNLGKQIEFEIYAGDETNLSYDRLKIVFDTLLHLVRNAVDHAIETKGKIEISLEAEENGWRLIVSDDGRGIDAEKIKVQAIEKNLVAADTILTEQELIDLIFAPEFSTKSVVTEISGRGIGLDAVKSAVEKTGGKISVKTEIGKGTTFEIFLP